AGSPKARIDGFTIEGADLGGAIFVNAYAHGLEIGNNRILNNQGTLGGGVRIGNPSQANLAGLEQSLPPSPNRDIRIHHNQIIENGSLYTGGGVAIYSGAADYQVDRNYLCGNFSRRGGGGLSQLGLAEDLNGDGVAGIIARNDILFNEVFQGDEIGGGGGGIELAGEAPPLGAPLGTLTQGTGSVTLDSNRIQGNLAGAADGGGIALRFVNGQDVQGNPADPGAWYRVNLFNNVIVNNVTGLAGGGISLQDAARVSIVHNTVTHNDSAATAADAFPGDPSQSTPQVAGIVSRAHSPGLAAASGQGFSNPELRNDIVWRNRSFFWRAGDPPALLDNPAGLYQDLGVVGTAGRLDPQLSVLTDTTGYALNNTSADPRFAASYLNALRTAAAADEGGNFVQVLFTPLAPTGDYHLGPGSSAIDAGTDAVLSTHAELSTDFEGDARPDGDCPDSGADEALGLGGTVPGGCGQPIASPQAPVAENDLYRVNSFTTYSVAAPGVLGNDADANDDPLTAALTPGSLTQGTLVFNADGSFRWAPPSVTWVGTATFRYRANDGILDSNEATVTLDKEMAVERATLARGTRTWDIRGKSTAPEGTQVTVYYGPDLTGPEIGTTTVFRTAQGQLRWRLTVPAGPVPGRGRTISAESGTGAQLLGVPFTIIP
ncbi:MAG: Ig-like domain-containing protein, partial [Deltaproteobacteria bacterium]|nr:Ig-like domain-containing protein [Deltaproteobacteria bacterium]